MIEQVLPFFVGDFGFTLGLVEIDIVLEDAFQRADVLFFESSALHRQRADLPAHQ